MGRCDPGHHSDRGLEEGRKFADLPGLACPEFGHAQGIGLVQAAECERETQVIVEIALIRQDAPAQAQKII